MSEPTDTPIDPAAGLSKINILCPESASDYPETVINSVKELFSDESTQKVLIGVEGARFVSRRDEHMTFQELRRLGFLPTNLYTPPTEDFFNILVTRK